MSGKVNDRRGGLGRRWQNQLPGVFPADGEQQRSRWLWRRIQAFTGFLLENSLKPEPDK